VAAKGGERRRELTGGKSRVEERPREVSGSVQGRSGVGLGRLSRAGRRSTTSGLVALADSVGASGRGSGAGVRHRPGDGGQEGNPGVGDSTVRVRAMFERESERRGQQHAGAIGRPRRGGALGGAGCRGGGDMEEPAGGR
jgi:hypothetical protein